MKERDSLFVSVEWKRKTKTWFVPDLMKFEASLTETIAWCRLHASVADPTYSLRTPELRPSNMFLNSSGNIDYERGTVEAKQAVVSDIAQRRARLLRAQNVSTVPLPSDLAGGRLLIACPEESDTCCLSEEASQGFIDALDVPAWDTWVCYIHEPTTLDPEYVQKMQKLHRYYIKRRDEEFVDWQPSPFVSYLLCWIPPQFVDMVEQGILVNPVECFFWAADYKRNQYNTPLLRQLDGLGLLT